MKKMLIALMATLSILPNSFAQTKKIPTVVVIDKIARAEFRGSQWQTTEGFVRDNLIPFANRNVNAVQMDLLGVNNVNSKSELDKKFAAPVNGVLIYVTSQRNLKRSTAEIEKGFITVNIATNKKFASEDEEAAYLVGILASDVNAYASKNNVVKKNSSNPYEGCTVYSPQHIACD